MKRGKGYEKSVYQSLVMITQFGITMLVPIFLCSFLGWYIDNKLGTSYLFIVMFFVGALAGFRNIYVLTRKVSESTSKTIDFETERKKLESHRQNRKQKREKK